MKRGEFLKKCCFACIASTGVISLLEGCISASVSGNLTKDNKQISVPKNAFLYKENNVDKYKDYLVITNDNIKYPICLFRNEDKSYTALLMRCTHQGAELQVFGEMLQCPAHGSEFNRKGEVISGPAVQKLREFSTKVDQENIFISLVG